MKSKKIINLKVGDSVRGIGDDDSSYDNYTGKVDYVNDDCAGIIRDDMMGEGGDYGTWDVTKLDNGYWGSDCEDGCLYYLKKKKIINWKKRLK